MGWGGGGGGCHQDEACEVTMACASSWGGGGGLPASFISV